jgi:selenide,water dikinase
VRLTLITREVHTPYSGMLPGLIAGRYSFDEAHIDTGPLTRFAAARLYQSTATGIDVSGKRVVCDNRPPVPYDVLAIDTGSTPNTATVSGAAEHAIAVKPISRFLSHFEALMERVRGSGGYRRIAVVGAGAGGVELMLALEARLRQAADGYDTAGLNFTLVTETQEILPGFPAAFARRFRNVLDWRRIDVLTGARVTGVDTGRLLIEGRAPLPADEVLWATGAGAPGWLESTGLALDDDGFLKVGSTLQAEGHDDIFGAGDVISFIPRKLPKSGVYAVRTGPVLAENIRRLLAGEKLKQYTPQLDALYLVSDGLGKAVGTRNRVTFSGAWVWRWKDRIDREFMQRFNDLPDMPAQAPGAASPLADKSAVREIVTDKTRCGGCGAKVGPTVLSRALAGIKPAACSDVVVGLDVPDDAAIVDTGGALLAVQTVDYFRALIDDPYLFGKIAANHAMGDVFAMGGKPQTALAIATVPYGMEAKVEADLSAMLTGANDMLCEAGCALVGGHSAEGAELALGFAVNGLIARERTLRKSGMQPGDALILTKPLGTGTLLAADMRGKAKARWVMAAIAHMTQSSQAAADILHKHGAHAATDVSGFGLLGHLAEMAKAGADAAIALHALPLLDGVRETLAMRIFSSLQSQNVQLREVIANLDEAGVDALYPALFDPQTAGGLLAAIPSGAAPACIDDLRAAGYAQAAVIGSVAEQSNAAKPITIILGQTVPSASPAPRPQTPAAKPAKRRKTAAAGA